MATLDAMYQKEHRHHKFLAMLKGIDIDEGVKNGKGDDAAVTFEEVKARAALKVTGNIEVANAERFGFKVEENGTQYQIVGLDGNQ